MPKKKKAAPKKKKEEVFFVGIKDPIELRRSLLESSKEMVQYLQRNERFKEIRKEKAEEILKLKALIEDMQKLMRKVKSELPKTNIRASAKKRVEKEEHKQAAVAKRKRTMAKNKKQEEKAAKKAAKAKEVPAAPPEKPKKLSDLEKLEAELGEIESQLTKIS